MRAPPPHWTILSWLALGVALAVLPFVSAVGSAALIGLAAWIGLSLAALRRRSRGGMPKPDRL